jgi:RNA polymerase sigma factor (sigma-70 family)
VTASGQRDGGDAAVFAILEPVVRRVIAARVRGRDLVDDLVQETLTRVLAARPKLENEALIAYTVVAAQRVVFSHVQKQRRRQRLESRLADMREPEPAEAAALAEEERTAMRAALARLSEEQRASLMAHDVMGVDRASLAETAGSSSGTIGVRLTRARAKLRVEYLLAFRRAYLPTQRCRPVLLAISAGDHARQAATRVGEHLLGCPTCRALSAALLEKHRPLAGVWPIPLARSLWDKARAHPAGAGAIGASTTAVAVAVALAWPHPSPKPPVTPPPLTEEACGGTLTVGGRRVPLDDEASVRQLNGQAVEGRHLLVQSVPANEGLWVGCDRARMWIQLVGEGESPFTLTAGQRIDFVGTLVPHAPGFSAMVGLSLNDGAADLDRRGYHTEVLFTKVVILP